MLPRELGVPRAPSLERALGETARRPAGRPPDRRRPGRVRRWSRHATPKRPLEPGEAVFWLSRERFCRALDRIVEMGPAAPQITFDDGNASDLDVAAPLLARAPHELSGGEKHLVTLAAILAVIAVLPALVLLILTLAA